MPVEQTQAPAIAGPKSPTAPVAATVPDQSFLAGLQSLNYAQLKAKYDELQNQRQDLANRRSSVASTYARATGINQDGIGARLAVMDKSMVQIEEELSAVGQAMVGKAQVTYPGVPPYNPNPGRSRNAGPAEMLAMGAVVFLVTMVVIVPASVRRAKRRWMSETPSAGSASIGQGGTRLDRIEQAVDTIAVEIERISENQRFMTRLMTETQLAGTIAAVRGSAEAAKAAAEGSDAAK